MFLTTWQSGTEQFSLESTSILSLAARGDLVTRSCVIWWTEQRSTFVSDGGFFSRLFQSRTSGAFHAVAPESGEAGHWQFALETMKA